MTVQSQILLRFAWIVIVARAGAEIPSYYVHTRLASMISQEPALGSSQPEILWPALGGAGAVQRRFAWPETTLNASLLPPPCRCAL